LGVPIIAAGKLIAGAGVKNDLHLSGLLLTLIVQFCR
jgi:hypothetical protein